MARSTYLSIITFKCQLSKRSDQKTEWLTELKKKLDYSGRRNMKTGKNLGLYRRMKSSAGDKYRNRYNINCFPF